MYVKIFIYIYNNNNLYETYKGCILNIKKIITNI